MTDKQIAQFIEYRATKNARQLGLHSPKLVIFKNISRKNLYIGVTFDNNGKRVLFALRFSEGQRRAIFKLQPNCQEFDNWQHEMLKAHGNEFTLEYDIDKLPACVLHFVSYAIIEALKTKGMGFDLFSLDMPNDVNLISGNETYEAVAIETDLVNFNFNESELTFDLTL